MPKIFLIKNRLHQQQLKLLEAHGKSSHNNSPLSSSIKNNTNSGYNNPEPSHEPLSLIVDKDKQQCEYLY